MLQPHHDLLKPIVRARSGLDPQAEIVEHEQQSTAMPRRVGVENPILHGWARTSRERRTKMVVATTREKMAGT